MAMGLKLQAQPLTKCLLDETAEACGAQAHSANAPNKGEQQALPAGTQLSYLEPLLSSRTKDFLFPCCGIYRGDASTALQCILLVMLHEPTRGLAHCR